MLKINKKHLHCLEKCGIIYLPSFPSLALGSKIKWQEEKTYEKTYSFPDPGVADGPVRYGVPRRRV
jgi:hypothetical protein